MDLFFKQAIPYHRTLELIYKQRYIYYHYNTREKLHHFRFFIIVIATRVIQHSIISFFPLSSTLWQLLFVDILQIGGLPPISNIFLVFSLLLGGYFIYLNYFDPEHYALDLMGNIIIRKRCHLFTQNKRNIFHHIARYCLKVLNLFQAFTLFIDLFIVACEVIGLKILYQLSAEANSTKVLISTGISWQANILLYHGSIFTFAYALILQGTIAFVLIEIIRLLLQQQQGFLEKLKRAKNQRSRVRLAQRYQNRYTDLLIAICRSNCYASKAFIPLMLVNFPTNGVLMVSLLTISKQMWPVTRVTLFVIMIEQFLCIFIVHSLLALLNDRLAAFARRYIPFHYSVFHPFLKINLQHTRQKLKSSLFIEHYNVAEKPYGFNYKFGHISSFNFGKV